MKILLYHWDSYYERDIQEILKDAGITFDTFSWTFQNKNVDDAFLSYIKGNIDLKQYTLLFSVNYWPLLSEICQKDNIPYVAWCYDNPLNVRDTQKTLGNGVNHVYCFDRIQTENYQRQGFQTVYHLPLGINSKRLSKISPSDKKCFSLQSQISFVGKLYESATDLIMSVADEYCKGYMQALVETQRELYGAYIIDVSLTESFMQKLNKSFHEKTNLFEKNLEHDEINFALACECTRRDRIILLSLMGTRFQTKFYSFNNSSVLKGVEKCPTVDYWSEMPYVFAASKINLNPSLRAIQTGIPLRALDIMACGGFLLSNYQEELADHFINEKEMLLYDSLPNAVEYAKYYLSHEDTRQQIALRGREKTLLNFNMKDRLAYMLNNLQVK